MILGQLLNKKKATKDKTECLLSRPFGVAFLFEISILSSWHVVVCFLRQDLIIRIARKLICVVLDLVKHKPVRVAKARSSSFAISE